jgi:hypothetical protein
MSGVYWHRPGLWLAMLTVDKKPYKSYHKKEIDAAKAYDGCVLTCCPPADRSNAYLSRCRFVLAHIGAGGATNFCPRTRIFLDPKGKTVRDNDDSRPRESYRGGNLPLSGFTMQAGYIGVSVATGTVTRPYIATCRGVRIGAYTTPEEVSQT